MLGCSKWRISTNEITKSASNFFFDQNHVKYRIYRKFSSNTGKNTGGPEIKKIQENTGSLTNLQMAHFWKFGANFRQFWLKYDQFHNLKHSKHPQKWGKAYWQGLKWGFSIWVVIFGEIWAIEASWRTSEASEKNEFAFSHFKFQH